MLCPEPAVPADERQAEAVVGITDVFDLYWLGSEPISAIVRRHNLKVGDKLYTHPAPATPRVVTEQDIKACFKFQEGWNHSQSDKGRYRAVLEAYELNRSKK